MSEQIKLIPGSSGGQSILAGMINHKETYGPHVIKSFLQSITKQNHHAKTIVDLGAGSGRDLQIAHEVFPCAKTIAVESYPEYIENLRGKVNEIVPVDIEHDVLPFESESLDVIIANQVLEHTKEIFWIAHEATRCLKVGGHFIIGVPNIASLHNRLLLLMGQHPTQHKLYSAHVRPFSKTDTVKFMDVCFPGGYELAKFAGSQFYPLPGWLTRIACKMLPNMSFSIFFMFKKLGRYSTEFLDHPVKARLETPFYLGKT